MKPNLRFFRVIVFLTCVSFLPVSAEAAGNERLRRMSLEACIAEALENNARRAVSRAAIEIADAQYRQALSSWWPQVSATFSAVRMDDDPEFVFPQETDVYSFNMGMGPMPVHVEVPEKVVKLMDRDVMTSSVEATLPLYTGGRRTAVVKQAEAGVAAARQASRRTDLKVVFDTRRMYYGAVLATRLKQLGHETLENFKLTLELTERLYKTGTGTVKKTDYLRTKTVVGMVGSMQEGLVAGEEMARSALGNTIGLEWNEQVAPADTELPRPGAMASMDALVADTYSLSPDWEQLQLGLAAAEAGIQRAKAGHFPIVALTAKVTHIENDYAKGIVTAGNSDSWSVGVGVQVPLFTGFRTTHEIRGARARLDKLRQEKILLRQGLALQVRDAFLRMKRARGQADTLVDAIETARENSQLNIRAYQNELVETKEVIEAQILESLVQVNYLTALYDWLVGQARLDAVVGYEMEKMLKE